MVFLHYNSWDIIMLSLYPAISIVFAKAFHFVTVPYMFVNVFSIFISVLNYYQAFQTNSHIPNGNFGFQIDVVRLISILDDWAPIFRWDFFMNMLFLCISSYFLQQNSTNMFLRDICVIAGIKLHVINDNFAKARSDVQPTSTAVKLDSLTKSEMCVPKIQLKNIPLQI